MSHLKSPQISLAISSIRQFQRFVGKFLLIGLAVVLAEGAYAVELPDNQGVSFSQLNFTYLGASQSYSSTGQVYVDYGALPDIGSSMGFINVVSPSGDWLVQNLPVVPDITFGLSSTFDLGISGPVSSLPLCVQYTVDPMQTNPGVSVINDFAASTGGLSTVDFNAQGKGSTTRTTVPVPAAPGAITFNPSGLNEVINQPGHALSVEQDTNQCGPAALANSLQYLENTFGLNVPHDNVPGIAGNPANSLVGQIDTAMGRAQGETVGDFDYIWGKLQYLGDNVDPNKISVKYQDDSYGGNITNNGVTAIDKGGAGNPTADFILSELKDGEDVELGITWDGGGGHWVDLIGGGTTLGVPWVAFVHDAKQGDNTTGTGLFEGGMGFSYLQDTDSDGYLNFANFIDGSAGEVDIVVSQSVVPLPPAVWLFGSGLVGLIGIAKCKKKVYLSQNKQYWLTPVLIGERWRDLSRHPEALPLRWARTNWPRSPAVWIRP